MTFRLVDPWLLLLAALPLWSWVWSWRGTSVPISSLVVFDGVQAQSWRTRLRWLPDALWYSAILLVLVAAARPQRAAPSPAPATRGRESMILVDVSGSMAVIDPGQTLSRLDRMKASLREAIRSPSLAPSDSIGLVLISEIPRVACPSTTDRESLMAIVDSLEVDPLRDRTNLGDAIALALDSLQKSGGRDGGILIYSDGAHNVAEGLSRREAARIAQALNVPISAVPLAAEDNDDADIAALRHVCEMTGGTFYSAADSQTESAGDRMPTFLGESPSREEQLWLWSDLFPQCLLAALAVLVVERLARWVIVRPL